jgi:enoyl-CoA hydratase
VKLSSDQLLVHRAAERLTLTINRPEKRNALKMSLLDEIAAALNAHSDDDSIKCAVITAAGDRCFAAGGDLRELDAIRSAEDATAMSQRGRTALDQVRQFPLPVIAALNGLAYGGGAELALACDLRVAVPGAEIGFLQAELNVTTAWGGGIDLIATVGRQKALDLLLSASRLKAEPARDLGIVDHVCGSGQVLDAGLEEFLAPLLERGTRVLRGFKALSSAHRQTLHAQLSVAEQDAFVASWTDPDHWLAVEQAFGERKNA